jgi:hypothetical protein
MNTALQILSVVFELRYRRNLTWTREEYHRRMEQNLIDHFQAVKASEVGSGAGVPWLFQSDLYADPVYVIEVGMEAARFTAANPTEVLSADKLQVFVSDLAEVFGSIVCTRLGYRIQILLPATLDEAMMYLQRRFAGLGSAVGAVNTWRPILLRRTGRHLSWTVTEMLQHVRNVTLAINFDRDGNNSAEATQPVAARQGLLLDYDIWDVTSPALTLEHLAEAVDVADSLMTDWSEWQGGRGNGGIS